MKEITNKTNGIVSANFLERLYNDKPKLVTFGIAAYFLAPVAKQVWPEIKSGTKYAFDSCMAYLNRKLDVMEKAIHTDIVDVTTSTYEDESTAA